MPSAIRAFGQGTGYDLVTRKFGPGVKAFVAGDDYRCTFIDATDQYEQNTVFCKLDRSVPELVDDDELGPGKSGRPELGGAGTASI